MTDIYEMLNKTKNNEEFKEVKLSDSEKEDIFNRVNNKIKRQRKLYKKLAACLMCVVLIGAVGTETGVLAAINESVENSISKMLGYDNSENGSLDFNKKDILQECESNGIKVTTYEALIENGEVVVSATLDYSNFNNEENNLPGDKEFIIEPYVFVMKSYGARWREDAFNFTVTQEGVEKELERSEIYDRCEYNEKEKTIDLLFTKKIIDYNSDQDCEININANVLTASVKKNIIASFINDKYDEVNIDGEWNFDFNIEANGKGIDNTKVHEFNNNLEIPYKDEILKYNLIDVKVSPLLIQVHHDVDFSKNHDMAVTHYKVYDQNDKELETLGGHGNSEDGVFNSYLNNGKITSIKLVPYLDINDTILGIDICREKEYKDKAVVIEIN